MPRVSRLFRRRDAPERKGTWEKRKEARYPSWITHREARYVRDRSSFIVVIWRVFGDSLLSTNLSSGETLDRLPMRTRVLPLGEKKREIVRREKKNERDEWKKTEKTPRLIGWRDRVDSSNR